VKTYIDLIVSKNAITTVIISRFGFKDDR